MARVHRAHLAPLRAELLDGITHLHDIPVLHHPRIQPDIAEVVESDARLLSLATATLGTA